MMAKKKYFFTVMKVKRNGVEKIKKQLTVMSSEQKINLWRDLTQNYVRRDYFH